ncbi:hypothetical protein Hdeb2414_s0026g00681441 [Helianthus debilis subsp. tardiflorus]
MSPAVSANWASSLSDSSMVNNSSVSSLRATPTRKCYIFLVRGSLSRIIIWTHANGVWRQSQSSQPMNISVDR